MFSRKMEYRIAKNSKHTSELTIKKRNENKKTHFFQNNFGAPLRGVESSRKGCPGTRKACCSERLTLDLTGA